MNLGLRRFVVVAAAIVGALFAAGSAVAVLFELQGFGTPRDTDPRTGQLLLYSAGIAAGIGIPLVAWLLLLPESSPRSGVTIAVIAACVAISVLGIAVVQ